MAPGQELRAPPFPMEGRDMRYAEGRPAGRLCCCAIVIAAVTCSVGLGTRRASAAPQSGPATTTVTDTVFNASGGAAQGTLIIEWPAFVTASGTQIASGNTSVALATN